MSSSSPSSATDTSSVSVALDFRAILHVLREKKWLIAAIVAACTATGAFYAIRSPKVFASTVTIEVEAEEQKLIKPDARRPEELTREEVLKTIEQKLESPALALRLVNHPELKDDPAFLPEVKRPAPEAKLRAAVSERITASVRRGTRLIDITVEDENPAMAQKLARLLVQEFLRGSAESRAEVSQVAHEYLRAEADRLKTVLTKSEQALQRYKEQHRAISLEEKQNIIVERLKELNAKVTAAKAERLRLESERAQIESAGTGSTEQLLALPGVANAPEVVELKRKINDAEAEMAALSRRYKPEHPRYIQTASQLAELQSGLNAAIRKTASMVVTALEAAQSTESKLEHALRGQEQLALELSEMAIPYNALAREVESDRALYNSLLARLKESDVAQDVSQHAILVVAPPLLPERPVRPNKRAILLLSLFGGLALALTATLGAQFLDGSLKTVDQAETALNLSSLSAVPKVPKAELGKLRRLLIERPHSMLAESFRGLRTALLLAGGEKGYRTVLFTSAVPGEGKSFCAVNYSIALAQQGYRTLLIDADLRLPTVGSAFLGTKETTGLSDVLLGQSQWDTVVRITDIENLSVLAAGTHVSNPAELVGKADFNRLFKELLGRFDRIVIDTAPVHAVSETLLIAPRAETVCFIVRSGETHAAATVRAVGKLRESGARIAGFVLNAMPLSNGGYYYHYHAPGYGRDEVYGATASATVA